MQESLSQSHGTQCGFCTPGFVMSMYTLLCNNPQPSAVEVENAFQGKSLFRFYVVSPRCVAAFFINNIISLIQQQKVKNTTTCVFYSVGLFVILCRPNFLDRF